MILTLILLAIQIACFLALFMLANKLLAKYYSLLDLVCEFDLTDEDQVKLVEWFQLQNKSKKCPKS